MYITSYVEFSEILELKRPNSKFVFHMYYDLEMIDTSVYNDFFYVQC